MIPDHVPVASFNEVTPNMYLDARQPDWLDAEMLGHVRYDSVRRMVNIHRRDYYLAVVGTIP